ncbi:PREDICTED: F-box/FBD/LRR-repeat protein At1g13570-like [Ipomoea nil]|uniref:F-box/FBD/LRR-repeat protein At1g13570-like n=1 Tax=Ipomoea nil TaxID=35883 RepID=UPI000901F71D|nr:PREDICTED: F-box/FBD/LRR-repeat protein At1g13570-like [Ipomoea nil]
MEEKDRISELPAGILDNIMRFMPILDAAIVEILSSIWKDIWFSLTKLCFDSDFFDYLCLKYSDEALEFHISGVVNNIFMRHNGRIHKVIFNFCGDILDFANDDIANLLKNNLNQWLLLLTQNGVNEMDISCPENSGYLVSNCFFSCPTLKRLKLSEVRVELVDVYELPNVISLYLEYVDFLCGDYSDYVVYLPMLEDLSFCYSRNIFDFHILAPKLGSLKTIPSCSCSVLKLGINPLLGLP